MIGRTYAVEDHGTIVTLWVWVQESVDSLAKDHGVPVHFDHSPFRWLVDARGHGRILGQEVEVTDTPEGPVIRFLDDDQEPLQFDTKPGAHDGFPF